MTDSGRPHAKAQESAPVRRNVTVVHSFVAAARELNRVLADHDRRTYAALIEAGKAMREIQARSDERLLAVVRQINESLRQPTS